MSNQNTIKTFDTSDTTLEEGTEADFEIVAEEPVVLTTLPSNPPEMGGVGELSSAAPAAPAAAPAAPVAKVEVNLPPESIVQTLMVQFEEAPMSKIPAHARKALITIGILVAFVATVLTTTMITKRHYTAQTAAAVQQKDEAAVKQQLGQLTEQIQKLKEEVNNKPKAQPEPAKAEKKADEGEANSFDHKIAFGEDPSLLARACSLQAKHNGTINKLPDNAAELAILRRLNAVKSNDGLPTKVDSTIKLPCDLSGENAKAIGWAKHRRAQISSK